MCKFKSGIIMKNRVVLAPEGNESHSDLLENLDIEDSHSNASRVFIRAELIPPNKNRAVNIREWIYIVDQDIVPDWYEKDPKRYEQEFRDAVQDWLKDRIVVICGHAWTPIKKDEKGTHYLLYGILEESTFGKTNNYAESDIRKKLCTSDLAEKLKTEFGDKLVPISTDLTSMDGFKDYGTVNGDILSIPTFDLYRECGEKIPLIDERYWLSTPNQTPSRKDSSYVRFVGPFGGGGCNDCLWDGGGVRPFFILNL